MAAEAVGGALLSVSLDRLTERIPSIFDFVRRKKIDAGLLNKLDMELMSVKSLLNDAEKKQLTDQTVRRWLEKLKDAIHDAEDLVDEIDTEALRREIEAGQSTGRQKLFSQVREFITARFNARNVETRIREILGMLEDIVKVKHNLGLKEGVVDVEAYPYNRGPSYTALVKGSDVYGRDADKKAITNLLLSDDEEEVGNHEVPVISIVALGGMGKTTLAQLVYDEIDPEAEVSSKKHFDFKIWITVSEEFNVFTLTKKIYEKALPEAQRKRISDESFELQGELEKNLIGKKFLLVLDDVWNEDPNKWCDFKTPFESAAHGSKILVTTRSGKIASMMDGVPNHRYQLKEIPEEYGWELFQKHALGNREQNAYDLDEDLEEIGRQIVKRCQGLPLAIKSLAGLLRSEIPDLCEWKKILKSDIWDLPTGCNILPALWLSYYYLPPHLKRCFAYCSIFPKDHEIEKQQLILLWMAQDLLQPQNTKTLEEVGEEYIKDLISRSFFHVDGDDWVTMHDLVNDLSKFISGESILRLDDTNCSDSLMRKTRHFSYGRCHTQEDIKRLKDVLKNTVLHTLRTLLGLQNFYTRREEYLIQPNQLQQMRSLRVFSPRIPSFPRRFQRFPPLEKEPLSTQLLDSFVSLKLLRYLDLSGTWIKELPASLCTLYNLQTLLLNDCSALIGLPDSIGNLEKLRYLDLSGSQIEKIPETICKLQELRSLLLRSCSKLRRLPTNITTLTSLSSVDMVGTWLEELPPQMSNLENLRTLPEFIVGKGSGARIKELGKLPHLRGDLHIKNLENVVDVEDVSKAILKDKKHITGLIFQWGWNKDTVVDSSCKAREVLDGLQPHTNLERLDIFYFGGTSFSQWVGHNSFSRLKRVALMSCKNCCVLPPLGQLPSLERLEISGFDMVESVGNEFYGGSSSSSDGSCNSSVTRLPFQSLKYLKFGNMPEWKVWSSSMNMGGYGSGSVFSNLKRLVVETCPKLDEGCLPDYLPSLKELEINGGSSQLVASLSRCQCPSLASLSVHYCDGIESFPQGRLPSSIRKITILGCRRLASLSEEGWPSDLNTLELGSCDRLFEHGTQWHLRMLTSLTSLSIDDMQVENPDSFLEEQLPTPLTSLKLRSLRNIKSLNGTAFRHLTSLQNLTIHDCKQLQGLPEHGLPATLLSLYLWSLPSLESLDGNALRHLTSLQTLFIGGCGKLQGLPELERLPATLSLLEIRSCPLLAPRCQRGTGEDWSKIQHISRIEIDYEDI